MAGAAEASVCLVPKSTLAERNRRVSPASARNLSGTGTERVVVWARIGDTGRRHDRPLSAHAAYRSTRTSGGGRLGAREQAGRVPLPRPVEALGAAVVSRRHRMDRQAP